MKQLIITNKVVSDFIEQPNAIIYKTYCPKCKFSSPRRDSLDDEISYIKSYTCCIPDGYPSLCEIGTIGFYKHNIKESIRLSNEARDEFHY
jgi:hypothetical protein